MRVTKALRRPVTLSLAAAAAALFVGCPLPFEFNGKGATSSTSDPSSPNMTAPITVSYVDQGGNSGTIADGALFTSAQTTTVTLTTTSLNAVIFYTTDGTALTNFRTAQKINGSSGTFTITRTTAVQSLDIHAVAVGPNMLPSPSAHATVSVSPYPIITVSRIGIPADSPITEDAGTATFTITSSVAPSSPLIVNLQASGTYHQALVTGIPVAKGVTFTGTIAAQATTTTLTITAQHDQDLTDEMITLTVIGDANNPPAYSVGAPYTATVTIQDDMAPTYTVTYDGNGNTGGTAPTDSNGYLAGAPVLVAGQGSLVRSAFTFGGWNTLQNGTGTPHGAGTTLTMGSANVVLYAVWTPLPTYSVTYNGNGNTGGAVPTDGGSYHTGDTAAVLGQGSLTNALGFFVGWNTAADGTGTAHSPGTALVIGSGNVILYAMWVTVTGGIITSIPDNVTNVVIPEGVTGILPPGPGVTPPFQGHPNLVSVTLPSTMASIPVQAFMGNPNLATIVSSSARYQVINGALVDTLTSTLMMVPPKLSGSFVMPSVTSVDAYAFDLCTSITNILIPASLTAISGNCFSGLRSFIPIVLPTTVTSIGAYAFFNSSVTSITVPASVTSIGTTAMVSCPNLTSVIMLGLPPVLGGTVFAAPKPIVHVPDAATQALYFLSSSWVAEGVTIVYP